MILITSSIILILAFNNVANFLEHISQTTALGFLKSIPIDWVYLGVFLFLVYVLFENKKIAKKLAGALK